MGSVLTSATTALDALVQKYTQPTPQPAKTYVDHFFDSLKGQFELVPQHAQPGLMLKLQSVMVDAINSPQTRMEPPNNVEAGSYQYSQYECL